MKNLSSNDLAFVSSLVDHFQYEWLFHVCGEFFIEFDSVVGIHLMRKIEFKQNYLVKLHVFVGMYPSCRKPSLIKTDSNVDLLSFSGIPYGCRSFHLLLWAF
jgi:hypothetical protein